MENKNKSGKSESTRTEMTDMEVPKNTKEAKEIQLKLKKKR